MNTTKNKETEIFDAMFGVGAHYGLPKARRHPSVKKYIYGLKQKTDVFDLEKIEELLKQAKNFAKKMGEERKTVLFVGGKPESHAVIKNAAENVDASYCVGRWIGGTITNFSEIKKRVGKLKRLLSNKESGALSKYTKLERLYIDREIEKLQTMYGGLVRLEDKLPSALFVIDPKSEMIAVKEAKDKNIPVIALANSDCDISIIDYPIVANDSARKSIEFFTNEVVNAYKEGLEATPVTTKEKVS
jgi:small subunit ribosomal protein S2